MKKQTNNKAKTVLVLVGIMMLSGILIPAAYIRYMDQQEFRPPFERRLHKNIQLMNDDGEVTSLSHFDNKLWVTFASSTQKGYENTLAHQQLVQLRKAMPDHTISSCIFLVDVTPNNVESLQKYRTDFATYLKEDDTLVAASVPVIQKYLKNEFRFGLTPYEKDGVWQYDRNIIIVDTKKHLRGHLDFERAEKLDRTAAEENRQTIAVTRLEELFSRSIAYLIETPEEESPFIRN